MIINIKLNDFINKQLSRTTSNIIEINIPVKVVYKIKKHVDIIIGELFFNDDERRAFVESNDTICEIVNRDCVKMIK